MALMGEEALKEVWNMIKEKSQKKSKCINGFLQIRTVQCQYFAK